MNRLRNERGIALAVAIFALVIIGGLVSAAFFVGVQEQRVGQNTVKLQQAFTAADGGAQSVVANWNTDTYNTMAVGATLTLAPVTLPNNSGWYRGTIKRLNTELFLVEAEGFCRDSTARQRVGVVVRLKMIEFNVNSALKTRGNLRIGGSSYIDGNDNSPTGWTGCPSLQPDLPGIRLPSGDSANISTSGCDNYSCLNGTPKIQTDNTITDSTLSNFGDAAFADLRGLATKVINGGTWTGVQPSLSGVACNTADVQNWGEPYVGTAFVACRTYFPIIWVEGDVSINGNRGQGILIVNGDLSVQGGFEWFGPVIVKGSLRTTGTGGHFNGGVIARNVDLEQSTVLGSAVVNYSSCALSYALNATAGGAQLRERGWINLY